MTIVEFYKKLSNLLTNKRENRIDINEAKAKLRDLLYQAENSEISVKISYDILNEVNLMRLDDENSFTVEDGEDGYDSDFISSF